MPFCAMMQSMGGETSFEVHVFGCAECPRVSSPSARGWRAYLLEDPDEHESPQLEFLCPDCARELGS